MEEYKGIYYGDETEQQFYEGGAHFKYSKLYRILEILAKERNESEKRQELLYVHKNRNLNNSKNTKINKKTRNVISDDINKYQYNTINNNFNNINYNIKNNFNIYLSINKENNNKNKNDNSKSLINNKNKIDKNLSLSNNKKDICSRNKETIKPYRGRPNTIFKDGFHKMLYTKKRKLLSLSMEQRTKYKNKCPVNLKRSLPELNIDCSKLMNDNKVNDNSYNNKIKVYKNKNIKNFKKKTLINNDTRPNISYSNANKITIKTERTQLLDNKNEKQITEHHTHFNKKISDKLFNRLNHTSSIKISKKVHNIIKKRIIGKRIINPKPKSNITSNVFQKSKIDKEKINIYINKSNKKEKTKKDCSIENNYNTLPEESNLKKNQFNSIKNELKNKTVNITGKKLVNLKKIDKNNATNINNNQLSFHKHIGKSRNYIEDNSSFNLKQTLNNNNLNNQNNQNTFFNDYFKTIGDINKTYDNNNKNVILNLSNSKNNHNNKIKQNNKLNLIYKPSHKNKNNLNDSKKQFMIKPYIQIKQDNNNLKNKINLNNSIRVNKKKSNNCFNINVNEND